jgi:hypothetical protein
MTREELHALVWSLPMRTLAHARGISDVALAKQCRSLNVPVPPREWWARKEAGRPVTMQPLPTLPIAAGDRYFPALDRQSGAGKTSAPATESSNGSEAPAPPVFRDMAAVTREIKTTIGTIRVPPALTNPHPVVVRLLKQDAERAANQAGKRYVSDWDGPKFATPIQQRRLRNLFLPPDRGGASRVQDERKHACR